MSAVFETLDVRGAFFECPRWHDGRLWVSDYWAGEVTAISPDGNTELVAEVPTSPSGLGWLPDGTLLVVSMMDSQLLRVDGSATKPYADLTAHSGPQCNDMVVDAVGRAYVSTIDFMAFAEMPTTNLVRVDPDGSVTEAADGLSFPNGSVITPDGSTLIIAESWAARLTAFDIQPDGELDVIACALGGPDGHTLYLCTTPDFQLMPDQAAATRPSRIRTRRVDVPTAGRV